MKKTAFILISLLSINFAFAQQKYHAFSVNGKYGITDTLGNEAIKPSHKYATPVLAKNQIYLQDFSDKADVIFNTKTGAKQLYESVYSNRLRIKNVSYSLINNKDKKFLLSEETDKTIPITRDYDDFYSAGNYIIAKYYAQEPFVSGGKDKNGRFLPPPIREMKRQHVVLTNDETLKPVVDKGFDKYLFLYKRPEETKEERIAKVEIITVKQIQESNPFFDYIILSQGNNHRLYNAKMVLVKAFVLAKPDEDKLYNYAEQLLKVNLSTMASEQHGYKSAPPMMASPSMGRSRNSSEEEPETKKPFKPFFYVKKLENGVTIFSLQETDEISKRIFEAKANVKVSLYERDCTITIRKDGKEDSKFSYNPKTGEIYLPKAYLAELGITLI